MKKMTDNEIIKALECCSLKENERKCCECPLVYTDMGCSIRLSKEALDLINRQKAEIEELTILCDMQDKNMLEQKAEIERLKDEASQLKNHLMAIESAANLYKKNHDVLERALQFQKLKNEVIKSETIKEFKEEYKNHIKSFTGMFTDEMGFMVNLEAIIFAVDFVADNLLKEMEGEENA